MMIRFVQAFAFLHQYIECLLLCNADTTSLFLVSRWATIPELKKKKKRKRKIAERKAIRPMRNLNENLPVITCLLVFFFVTKYSQSDVIDHIFVAFGVKVLLHTQYYELLKDRFIVAKMSL